MKYVKPAPPFAETTQNTALISLEFSEPPCQSDSQSKTAPSCKKSIQSVKNINLTNALNDTVLSETDQQILFFSQIEVSNKESVFETSTQIVKSTNQTSISTLTSQPAAQAATVEPTTSLIQDQVSTFKKIGTRSHITLSNRTTKNELFEYTVEQLKDCLKAHKLSQLGKKADLVYRVYDNLTLRY